MPHLHLSSRRQALQFLAGAPFLPLGALSASSWLAGCATSAPMAATTVAPSLQLMHTDGSTSRQALA